MLYRPRADGGQERACRGRLPRPGFGHGGARGGACYDRPSARAPGIEADNTDRRQALRRMGFCPEPAGTKRYAAYRRRRSSHQERQEAQDSH